MISYDRSLGAGYDVEHARAMALLALTMASAGITIALSRMRGLAAWVTTLGTITLSLLLVQVPILSSYLHLRPLHLDDVLLAGAGGMLAALIPLVLGWRRWPTPH